MYCVVKGAFEDYWFGSGATGEAHDKAYADSHYHSKPIEVAYHRAKPITLSKIIYIHILTVLIEPFLLFRDKPCVV